MLRVRIALFSRIALLVLVSLLLGRSQQLEVESEIGEGAAFLLTFPEYRVSASGGSAPSEESAGFDEGSQS